MRERSPFSLLVQVAIMVATLAISLAQDVDPHMEASEACTLRTGEQGRCLNIHYCLSMLGTSRRSPTNRCGVDGYILIVCCPIPEDSVRVHSSTGLVAVHDISQPTVDFECGMNSYRGHQFVQGDQDVEVSTWPWMALLGENEVQGIKWICGGVLINDQWVLSALHCFNRYEVNVVRLGEHNYESLTDADHMDFDVAEIVLYPGYIHSQLYHDLVLLRLDTRVMLQELISPVCLPWGMESNVNLTGQSVTLTGWGNNLHGGGLPSSVLQEVNITVFPSSTCDQSYSTLLGYSALWPRGIGNETVCAGDPNGMKDACQGDSGGPIVYLNSYGRYTLAGTVSRGFGCGRENFPGLYVNLRKPAYLAWIKKTAFGKPFTSE